MHWHYGLVKLSLKVFGLCLLALLGTQSVSWAAQVTVQARLAEAEIYLGESTTLEVQHPGGA